MEMASSMRIHPIGMGHKRRASATSMMMVIVGHENPSIAIGMEMELAVEAFAVDDEGREVVTFAFAPAGTN